MGLGCSCQEKELNSDLLVSWTLDGIASLKKERQLLLFLVGALQAAEELRIILNYKILNSVGF